MSAAKRDENREVALILQNTLGTQTLYPTAVTLTDSVAQHVAIVDGNGDQIISFGGTPYTDAAAAAAHPIGTGIIFNNAGTYNFVSIAQPLPIKPHDGTNPLYKSAAVLADSTANPTTGGIQNFPMVWNGTTWDRALNIAMAYGTFGAGIVATGMNVESPIDFKYYNLFGNPPNRDAISPGEGYALHANSFLLGYNGTNWDRLQVDASKNLKVAVAGGAMPAGTALTTYSVHLTTNTTTTPTASLAYISSIVISIDVIATTAGTLTIKDKSGTPLILVNGLNTTTAVSTTPTILNFQTPIKMTGGIDIVTAASVGQATLDVWINYYQ